MMRLERALLDAPDLAGFLTLVARIRAALIEQPDEVRALIQRLRLPAIEAQLSAAARQALAAGLADGLGILDEAGIPVRSRPITTGALPATVTGLVAGLDAAGETALGQALRLTRGDGIDPQAVAAPVLGYERRVRGTISDTITTAAAEGELQAAEIANVPLVWVAETTACVHCLAYSGVVVNPGDDFPAGLSYGRRPQAGSPGRTPPRHPRCRCEVEPLRSQDYADALRREADRSVLRGFSLESESMKTRIEAAEDLLERDPDAPKSVIEFARDAVDEGRFPTRGRPQ